MEKDINILQGKLDKLTMRDRFFASNLIESFHKHGRLTPKQAPWIAILTKRAEGFQLAPQAVKINVGSFSDVVALFTQAKAHLKWPKITLDCAGVPVILSVCGPASKTPGSIAISGEGRYPNRAWYGSISPSGEWTPSGQLDRNPAIKNVLPALLAEFGNDPAGVARKYGHLTGNCCFCHLALTDARSTAAGFGPTCADHYGLKEEWKAAANRAVLAESVAA